MAKTTRNRYQWNEPETVKENDKPSNFTQTVKEGVSKIENEIKEELGLKDEDDWIVTVIIAASSCLFTSLLCCLINWFIKKRRQNDMDEEMRNQ